MEEKNRKDMSMAVHQHWASCLWNTWTHSGERLWKSTYSNPRSKAKVRKDKLSTYLMWNYTWTPKAAVLIWIIWLQCTGCLEMQWFKPSVYWASRMRVLFRKAHLYFSHMVPRISPIMGNILIKFWQWFSGSSSALQQIWIQPESKP